MPQAANIILNDGTTPTPVARTFALNAPSAGLDSVAEWQYRKGDSVAGFPTITSLSSRTRAQLRKSTIKLVIPFISNDPVSGLPMMVDQAVFHVNSSFGPLFPESGKADAIAYFKNLMQNALILEQLRDGNPNT